MIIMSKIIVVVIVIVVVIIVAVVVFKDVCNIQMKHRVLAILILCCFQSRWSIYLFVCMFVCVFKTHFGLETILTFEPSTYQPIGR